MEEKKKRSAKSKVITVMLCVSLFCVFSILLLIIFDNGSLFGWKEEVTIYNESKDDKSNNKDSYVGKYITTILGDGEYFELFEDGSATIYTLNDDNGSFEEISTYYNISTEEETTILIFDEYGTELPGNWYTYPLDLTKTETGYRAIPSGYNNKCTGPSDCNIVFEK